MNKISLSLLIGAFALASCDDDTLNIGIDVMPDGDNITAQGKVFDVTTSTVEVSSVLANTSTCYLGSIVDPEMRVKTTCDFLAQFHLPQDFYMPKLELMVKNEEGLVEADSCDIRLYFDEYYGDSLETMKLMVQELDKDNVLEETENYYTDINPADFVDEATEYKKTISYAIKDMTRPEEENSGTSYYRQIAIKLPAKYGSEMMRKYYEHPEYFKNSYHFIRNVCPGFYFKSAGGLGSMITSKMIGMNVYFRYHTKTSAGNDTIVDGMQRFGATEEVIQSTRIDNEYPGSLTLEQLDNKNCTYVKTPTAFFTEMTLPIAEIAAGEHYTDSINQAKITIRKYNNETSSKYALPAPTNLLLVRKNKMDEFFEKKELPDNANSYLSTTYSTSTNVYQFSNISQLITNLRHERDLGAGVERGDDEATRNAKYAVWEAAHPDWNKVMLVPVLTQYTTSTDYYGQTVQTLRGVQHNLGLSSARIEGGKENPLKLEVVYSRLNR